MIEKTLYSSDSRSYSAKNCNQRSDIIKIQHTTCKNKMYYFQIVELIAEYLEGQSTRPSPTQGNIRIDKNLTKKCCQRLQMSKVFGLVKNYCLKCQKKINCFTVSEIFQFSYNNLAFCTKCIKEIQKDNQETNLKNGSIQCLLHKIIKHCQKKEQSLERSTIGEKSQSNYQEENHQRKQSCQNLSDKQENEQAHYNPQVLFCNIIKLREELSKITKDELIERFIRMDFDLRKEKDQAQKNRKQLQAKIRLLQLGQIKNNELYFQNNLLKESLISYQSQPSYSVYGSERSGSVKLFASKIKSMNTSISKSQSLKQSDNKDLINILEKFDDQNSLQHSLRSEDKKKYQVKEGNRYYLQNGTQFQSIIQQEQNQSESSSKIKRVTRSLIKAIPQILTNLNGFQNNMISTAPVNGISIQKDKKDSVIMQPVPVPIMKKHVSNIG